jgi:ribosomal protein L19E
MPRRKSLVTVIRELVQQEVRAAMQALFGSISTGKTKPKNGRRRRRRRRGPGRPPGSKNKKA